MPRYPNQHEEPDRRSPPHERPERRLVSPGRIAGLLAASGAANLLLARRAEAKHPPTGRLVVVGGVRLHYIEQGEGTPVVLLHGNGSLAEEMRISGLMGLLAGNHRVIAFDRPGHGYTERPRDRDWTPEAQAELFAAAADLLGLVNPVVVGHSFGVLPAIAWALARPHDVAGLGLIGGYYYPTLRPDALLQRAVAQPGLDSVLATTLMPIQGRITGALGNRFVFSPAHPTEAYKDQMPFELLLRPGQLRAALADGAQLPGSARRLCDRYAELHLPMLIAWGDGDKMVRQAKQSARLAAELPHAEQLCVASAGHMVHHTAPDAVADALEALCLAAAGRQRQLPELELRPVPNNGIGAPTYAH